MAKAKSKSKSKPKSKAKSKAKNPKKQSLGKRAKKAAKTDVGRAAIGGGVGGLALGPVGAAAGAGLAVAANRNPTRGDMTQARAFVLDCIGSHHVRNGQAVNRDVCCEAFKNAGGTKKDCNAALRQLKDEGWIEIKKRECRLTPKGMMHFVQASAQPTANPVVWEDDDTVVLTDPGGDTQVSVSRVHAADIEIMDLDDPRRTMRVMTPSYDEAVAAARSLTRNPVQGSPSLTRPGRQDYQTHAGDLDYHRGGHDIVPRPYANPVQGSPSLTRPGRQDYQTHAGDLDYHRGGHDVVPRPYMNPASMYRQGVVDRLQASSRRRNPDYQEINEINDAVGMHESNADRGVDYLIHEIQSERPNPDRIRKSIDAIRSHMETAMGYNLQLLTLEEQDEMDYGAAGEDLRLRSKMRDLERTFRELGA